MKRISDEVFAKLDTMEDLVNLMGRTQSGLIINEVGEPESFKHRLDGFKEFLRTDVPDLSIDEILKFDEHFHQFRKIYEWFGHSYLLSALEFEQRKAQQ